MHTRFVDRATGTTATAKTPGTTLSYRVPANSTTDARAAPSLVTPTLPRSP
jgi:hypothetical protein